MSSVARLQPDGQPAPEEVLATVAHELRQPLSNIESIAFYLTMILPEADEKLQGHLRRIRQLVEQSDWILESGLRLTKTPSVVPQPVSLRELISQAVAATCGKTARVRLECAEGLAQISLDVRQGDVMVHTLLEVLLPVATAEHPLVIRTLAHEPGGARIEFRGSLRPPHAVLAPGSSLAMECARRIAAAHGGDLREETDSSGGIRVVVMLP